MHDTDHRLKHGSDLMSLLRVTQVDLQEAQKQGKIKGGSQINTKCEGRGRIGKTGS